jgi:hypothetical protein
MRWAADLLKSRATHINQHFQPVRKLRISCNQAHTEALATDRCVHALPCMRSYYVPAPHSCVSKICRASSGRGYARVAHLTLRMHLLRFVRRCRDAPLRMAHPCTRITCCGSLHMTRFTSAADLPDDTSRFTITIRTRLTACEALSVGALENLAASHQITGLILPCSLCRPRSA